jgi:hypothetical protein
MALELKKAQRRKAKLKLGIASPSGGGKTLGALLIAYGLVKEAYPDWSDDQIWEKIGLIDSENGSGELYVGKRMGDGLVVGEYNIIRLEPPYEADKYTKAIEICHEAGLLVGIIDSTTHLWAGVGGALEQQGAIAKRTGNSYTAWRDVNPQITRFIDKMLQTDMHIIATMRSKTDYVQEKDANGKTTIRKVGLAPVMRDGMEFEFTTFLEIDSEHNAFGSKDRTGIVDQKYFVIDQNVGRNLMRWLESGTDNPDVVVSREKPEIVPAKPEDAIKNMQAGIIEKIKTLGGSANETLMATLMKYHESCNPNKIKDVEQLKKLDVELDDMAAIAEKENK